MVRPHSQSARRRYYRQLEADALAAAQAAANAAQAPAGPPPPQAGQPLPPPPVVNVADPAQVAPVAGPSPLSTVRHYASQITGPKEAALHKTRKNFSNTTTYPNKLLQKNKGDKYIQYVYISCEPEKIPGILRNLSVPLPPTPVPTSIPSPTTPSTSSGGQTMGGNQVNEGKNPVKKTIPALMDLQLSKPAPFSFASKHVSERVAKANAAQAALVKAGTLPTKVTPPTKTPFQAKAKFTTTTPIPTTLVTPLKLVLWGSSHLTDRRGIPAVLKRGIQFSSVLNKSEGGGKLDKDTLLEILTYLEANPDPNQLFIFLLGGNNLREAKRGDKEIEAVKNRFQTILNKIAQIQARVILCGLIPDPIYENLDYTFMDMDVALSTLNLGPRGTYVGLRTPVLDSQGFIREECYEYRRIHLSEFGAEIVGLTIGKLLKQIVRSAQVQIPIPTPSNPISSPIPIPQAPIQIPVPIQVPAIVETEEYLAGVFQRVRGYLIPPPPLPQPQEMEVDAPAEAESNVAPDYPESDRNDKNESVDSVEIVESDSESIILDSEKLMPTFYPKTMLTPNPQDELAGPSTLSNVVQTVLNDQTSFIPVRSSTPNPTKNDLDMLNQTSSSVVSQVSNASRLLADNDSSMIGQNETIVTQMKKLQPIIEEQEESESDLADGSEEKDKDKSETEPSGSKEQKEEEQDDEGEWKLVSHKRSKK